MIKLNIVKIRLRRKRELLTLALVALLAEPPNEIFAVSTKSRLTEKSGQEFVIVNNMNMSPLHSSMSNRGERFFHELRSHRSYISVYHQLNKTSHLRPFCCPKCIQLDFGFESMKNLSNAQPWHSLCSHIIPFIKNVFFGNRWRFGSFWAMKGGM